MARAGYQKEYYLKNKVSILEWHKMHREKPGVAEKMRENSRRWYADPENKIRRRNSRYNIDFNILKEKQDNCCAICAKPFEDDSKAFIEHDHRCCPQQNKSCGKCVRGLTCKQCNDGLVYFNDNWELLERASKYIFDAKVRYLNGN